MVGMIPFAAHTRRIDVYGCTEKCSISNVAGRFTLLPRQRRRSFLRADSFPTQVSCYKRQIESLIAQSDIELKLFQSAPSFTFRAVLVGIGLQVRQNGIYGHIQLFIQRTR